MACANPCGLARDRLSHAGMPARNQKAACVRILAGRYRRREPEDSVLHRIVREQIETFLGHRETQGRPVPRFVERELRGFLECGILAHGSAVTD